MAHHGHVSRSGIKHGYKVKRPLQVDEEGGCVHVPLTRGRTAVVDLADIAKVEGYNWHTHSDGYVARGWTLKERQEKPRVGICYLHRWISECPPGLEVDHIDGDPLNNRRANLRHGSHRDNLNNRVVPRPKSRAPKGVRPCGNSYGAQVTHRGKSYWGGSYADPYLAWIAASILRCHLHGEFANHGLSPLKPNAALLIGEAP